MSTVLGPAIEFAFTAGYVVAARSTAVPGVEDLVLMAANGARRVDVVDGLVQPTASLSPRLADRDRRGDAYSPGDRKERPDHRRRHKGRSVTQPPVEPMPDLSSGIPQGHLI